MQADDRCSRTAAQARQDAEKLVATPFALAKPPSRAVLGYYTLSSSVLSVGEVTPELKRKLQRYPQSPVTSIGRLAADVRLEGHGCGEYVLMDALRRSPTHSAEIAAMAAVVEAKDETAAAFYRHSDLEPLQSSARRLYLPMRTVQMLLG